MNTQQPYHFRDTLLTFVRRELEDALKIPFRSTDTLQALQNQIPPENGKLSTPNAAQWRMTVDTAPTHDLGDSDFGAFPNTKGEHFHPENRVVDVKKIGDTGTIWDLTFAIGENALQIVDIQNKLQGNAAGLMISELTAENSFLTPCRVVQEMPCRPANINDSWQIPALFVSWDGGRKSRRGRERSVMQNTVENIGIRLEWVFRDEFGAIENGIAKPMSRQVSNVVYDIERILNFNTCTRFFQNNVLRNGQPDIVVVEDVLLMEWGFNSMYRGTPNEVLICILQFTISYPKSIEVG